LFYGFLPHQPSARKTVLGGLASLDYPVVFYESPHRLTDTLRDVETCMGKDRQLILAKEITKVFEQMIQGKVAEIFDWLTEERCKGEFVLIVLADVSENTHDADEELTRLLTILLRELPLKQAVSLVVEMLNIRKNTVYAKALELSKSIDSNIFSK
jgi:16S rRNA (cytidine1402-2'-O)-methyltransferase